MLLHQANLPEASSQILMHIASAATTALRAFLFRIKARGCHCSCLIQNIVKDIDDK